MRNENCGVLRGNLYESFTEQGTIMKLKTKRILRLCCMLAGAACICIGIRRGECAVILQKAVKICLECIGLG